MKNVMKMGNTTISRIMESMIAFSDGNIRDINHLICVWGYAKTIGELEQLDRDTQFILEVAAITHDIACPLCRRKYGNADGKLQEKEGDPLVRRFLSDKGLTEDQIERVAFLAGHHHTLAGIDGPDWQILVEADYIVNAAENGYSRQNIDHFIESSMRTESGKRLARSVLCQVESFDETDPMDAMTALLTRRSTRNYLPRPVEKEKLDKLLAVARQAPSGGNHQANHFLVIQNRDVLDKLAGMTESAFAGMEVDEDTYSSLRHAILASKKGGYVFCYNAPVLIVVANRRDYGNNMADCACAIENIMVAANALDLGSCWINQLRWLNEEPALVEYLRSLGMKEYERVYGAVIVGYPATDSGLPNRNLMVQKGNETTYID